MNDFLKIQSTGSLAPYSNVYKVRHNGVYIQTGLVDQVQPRIVAYLRSVLPPKLKRALLKAFIDDELVRDLNEYQEKLIVEAKRSLASAGCIFATD